MASLIQVRVDEELKREADTLFRDLGLDTTTAIRIFLKQAVSKGAIPFEIALSDYTEELNIRADGHQGKGLIDEKEALKKFESIKNGSYAH